MWPEPGASVSISADGLLTVSFAGYETSERTDAIHSRTIAGPATAVDIVVNRDDNLDNLDEDFVVDDPDNAYMEDDSAAGTSKGPAKKARRKKRNSLQPDAACPPPPIQSPAAEPITISPSNVPSLQDLQRERDALLGQMRVNNAAITAASVKPGRTNGRYKCQDPECDMGADNVPLGSILTTLTRALMTFVSSLT